jgi:hypothetical protein
MSITWSTNQITNSIQSHRLESNPGGRDLLQAAFTEEEKANVSIACLADVVAMEETGDIKLGGGRS